MKCVLILLGRISFKAQTNSFEYTHDIKDNPLKVDKHLYHECIHFVILLNTVTIQYDNLFKVENHFVS